MLIKVEFIFKISFLDMHNTNDVFSGNNKWRDVKCDLALKDYVKNTNI